MTPKQFIYRTKVAIREEMLTPERWIYLSFADERGFLGGVITRAYGVVTASRKAHAYLINPGGEVSCCDYMKEPPADMVDKLLTREQVENL